MMEGDDAPVSDIHVPDLPELSAQERMSMERETTGLYLSGHPMDDYREQLKGTGAVPIGQVLGRWGNFFNCEAFGSETSLPWRMVIGKGLDEAGQFGNHPTFFYESAWNAIGFVLLYFYSKKRKYRGEVLLLYFGWYGLGRFFIEGLRTDSLYLWGTGIRVSQVVALISVIIGFGGFLLNRVMPFLRETAAEVNDNDTNTEETT